MSQILNDKIKIALAKAICVLRQSRAKHSMKMQKRKTWSLGNDLKHKNPEFIAEENFMDTVEYSHPDNPEAQVRSHEQVENAKNVTKLAGKTR